MSDLERRFDEARDAVAKMTPEERTSMWEAQRRSFARAEAAFGTDADEAEYRAAMESGDAERIAVVSRTRGRAGYEGDRRDAVSDEIERLCERLEKAATSSNDGDLRGVSLEAAAALRALQAENERLKAEVERLQGAVALLGGRVDAQDMRDASSLDLAREWEDHCKRAEAALADARAAAFEEAAKVADGFYKDDAMDAFDVGWASAAVEIEAAIRALAHGEKG